MKNLDSSSCLVCQDYTRGLRGRYIGVLAFVEDGHARSSRRTGAAHRLASPLLCGRENRVVVPTPAGHVVSAGTLAQPVGGVRAAVSCRRPHRAMALQEKEERIRQRHPERKDLREAALNEMQCPTLRGRGQPGNCGWPTFPRGGALALDLQPVSGQD